MNEEFIIKEKEYPNGLKELSCHKKAVKHPSQDNKKKSTKKNKQKSLKDDKRKKKYRFKDLAESSPVPLNYAFTLTSGVETERINAKILRKLAKDFLEKANINYVFALDCSHPRNDKNFENEACSENGFHIHGLSDKPFDMDKWCIEHNCTYKALYLDEIRNIDKYINYITRNCDKIHGTCYYSSNFSKKPNKTVSKQVTRLPDFLRKDNGRYVKDSDLLLDLSKRNHVKYNDRNHPLSIAERLVYQGKEPSKKQTLIVFKAYLDLAGGESA